ncbi:MAG: CBS domain-containing protein, partial [Candidatus Brocadiia bacterium]
VTLSTPLVTILEYMSRFGGRCLVVVNEQGKTEGIITVFSIFKTLLKRHPNCTFEGKTPQAPQLV